MSKLTLEDLLGIAEEVDNSYLPAKVVEIVKADNGDIVGASYYLFGYTVKRMRDGKINIPTANAVLKILNFPTDEVERLSKNRMD